MNGDQSYERDFAPPRDRYARSRAFFKGFLILGGAMGIVGMAYGLSMLWGGYNNPEIGLVEQLEPADLPNADMDLNRPAGGVTPTDPASASAMTVEPDIENEVVAGALDTLPDTVSDRPVALRTAESPGEPDPVSVDAMPIPPETVPPAEAAALSVPAPLPRPAWISVAKVGAGDAPPATAAPIGTTAGIAPKPASKSGGKVFKDCDTCPEMAVLPAGSFNMGSPDSEPGRYGYEGPQHLVTLKSFAIGTREVTFEEWDACVADKACKTSGNDHGWGRGTRPALGISWNDAQIYVKWLSQKTGKSYRLPTEAEWEYAARAGSEAAYWWGDAFDASQVATGTGADTASLNPNAFGLYDMLGNAREWVEDCYVATYDGAPADGSAVDPKSCPTRVIRGGYWASNPADMRSANRARIGPSLRTHYMGFRVAMDP